MSVSQSKQSVKGGARLISLLNSQRTTDPSLVSTKVTVL